MFANVIEITRTHYELSLTKIVLQMSYTTVPTANRLGYTQGWAHLLSSQSQFNQSIEQVSYLKNYLLISEYFTFNELHLLYFEMCKNSNLKIANITFYTKTQHIPPKHSVPHDYCNTPQEHLAKLLKNSAKYSKYAIKRTNKTSNIAWKYHFSARLKIALRRSRQQSSKLLVRHFRRKYKLGKIPRPLRSVFVDRFRRNFYKKAVRLKPRRFTLRKRLLLKKQRRARRAEFRKQLKSLLKRTTSHRKKRLMHLVRAWKLRGPLFNAQSRIKRKCLVHHTLRQNFLKWPRFRSVKSANLVRLYVRKVNKVLKDLTIEEDFTPPASLLGENIKKRRDLEEDEEDLIRRMLLERADAAFDYTLSEQLGPKLLPSFRRQKLNKFQYCVDQYLYTWLGSHQITKLQTPFYMFRKKNIYRKEHVWYSVRAFFRQNYFKQFLYALRIGQHHINAQLIGELIAEELSRTHKHHKQIGRNISILLGDFRPSYVKGFKLSIKGKLGGKDQSDREWFRNVKSLDVPTQQFNKRFTYSLSVSRTYTGLFGTKLWITY